jgi:hypothetical protein
MRLRHVHAITCLVLTFVAMAVRPAHAANDTALKLANASATTTCYVHVANDAAFSLQTFTIEAWVQRSGTGFGQTTDGVGGAIIAKPAEGTVGSNLASWTLNWSNSGQLFIDVAHTLGGTGVIFFAPAVATPLARHHVAATFDGATVKLYVDGVMTASQPWALGNVYYGAESVLIGADNYGAGYYRRFDGAIDDVRIWDHARTATEIANALSCRLTGHESGLVAYWTFDNFDLTDLTGHGHNGTAATTAGALTYGPLALLGNCTTGVDDVPGRSGADLAIALFPQPARDRVTVSYTLPRTGPAHIDVLDVAGRRVAVWDTPEQTAGTHQFSADVSALRAGAAGSGVFFVRMRAAGETTARTLVLRR